MKKTETLFICLATLVCFAVGYRSGLKMSATEQFKAIPETHSGAFLAAQHAIYVNDFDAASAYSASLADIDAKVVKNTRMMADFLSGRLPDGVKELEKESGTPSRLIYDAYLAEQGDWEKIYSRHKKDDSAFIAPLRIISSAAIKHRTEAIKFVDSLSTNESWKAFARGMIYAENGDIEKAEKEFADVHVDFMNINDYLYLMSFYLHYDYIEDADILREDFAARPGGMFMLDYDNIPDWSVFSGYKNALAFSLIQNVSHTQVMMYSDLSVLLLRFAQIISGDTGNMDAINYYIGQFLFNNNGDYKPYFDKISKDSPFYLFVTLRDSEKTNDITKLRRILHTHPSFVPAMSRVLAYYIAHGDKSSALKTVNRAMDNEKLSDASHAFLLKNRAQINFVFGDLNAAQSDIHAASDVLGIDEDILSIQSKIWSAQNRELETAYDYGMTLVRLNMSNVCAWEVLARAIAVREGDDAALELVERVGEVAKECSSLFEFLGDLYSRGGNTKLARDAYMRAIDLSEDGLVIVPQIEKKVRKLK